MLIIPGMTKADAVAHYGSQQALALALGITRVAVSLWGEYPPPRRQMQLERLTFGVLRAEPGVWDGPQAVEH
jgi:DNA-binding transcriptional regulator YdaS (Cro superfamily)